MLPKTKSVREPSYLKKTYLIYGAPKVGKSTLVSNFGGDDTKVLFFTTESGHKELEVYKWTTDAGLDPSNWEHFRQCVIEFTKSPDFSCIAIDTTKNLFEWCRAYVFNKHGISHESESGFGKGWDLVRKEFFAVVNYLSQQNKGVIFISHRDKKNENFNDKQATYIDADLPNQAKTFIEGMVDYIFYCYIDFEGNRLIRTKGNDAINAGDRSGRLPEIMPMDSRTLVKALKDEGSKPLRNYAPAVNMAQETQTQLNA